MDSNPLVSIIIPVYNVEKYLRQCIESVIAQTYQNLEIILIDDGSTDSSRKICDEYAGKYSFVSVMHQKNEGLSGARNKGLSLSSGEYVAFVDSDDWISSDNIEKMVSQVLSERSDFIFSDALCFEESSKGYQIKQHYKRENAYSTDTGHKVFSELQKHKDFHCAVQMYLWKRSFLSKNSLTFYPGIIYEDMIFTFKAFLVAKQVSHCPVAIYHRRFRPGSIVTSKPTYKNFWSANIVYTEVSSLTKSFENEYTKGYCARCAFKALDLYKNLSIRDRKIHNKEFSLLKQRIKENKYHDEISLKMMIYGKLFWLVYKATHKVFNVH